MLFFSPYRYRGQLYSIIYGQAIPSVIGQKSVALTLKKAGYADIPDHISRLNKMPIKHEIVKLEVTPDVVMTDNLPEKMEQNACFSNEPSKDSVVEIVLSNATIRFVNNTISVC